MIKTQEISGKIVCGEDIISGTIIFEDIIKDLKSEKDKNYTNYIIPGFIDLHCHGGNGYDSMEGLQSIKKNIGISFIPWHNYFVSNYCYCKTRGYFKGT